MLTGLEHAVARLDLDVLAGRRWFAGKGRGPVAARLVDALEVPDADGARLVLVDVEYDDGTCERYLVPARRSPGELKEAGPEDPLWAALARLVAEERELPGLHGVFATLPGPIRIGAHGRGRALTDDQSNTSVVLEEALVVKSYRRILPGTHPEPEALAALAGTGSLRAPGFAGALVRRSVDSEEALVCAYSFVPGEPVGWEQLIERVQDAVAGGDGAQAARLATEMARLGEAAAELHVDLGRAFGVVPASAADGRRAVADARAQLGEARVGEGELARVLEDLREDLDAVLAGLVALEGAPTSRCHGDLHVAQLVDGPDGLVAVDFEGEPGRPLAVRRRPGTPLRDLACLLLSLDHSAVAAARRLSFGPALDQALAWSAEARRAVTESYRSGIEGSELVLDDGLLRALEVEKECQEVLYAATVLPEWSYAPAHVLPRLVDRSRGTAA